MTWEVYLLAAEGYCDLEMYQDAHDELERMPAEDRSRPEVYGLRVRIYHALEKWELCAVCAKHMTRVQPDVLPWWACWAFAVRRSESIEAAEKILIQALVKFPEAAILYYNLACYTSVMGRLREAKSLLAEAINRDESYKLKALDDEDLRAVWDEVAQLE